MQSIFVQCPNWVGDFIMCTPSLRSLRKKYPDAHITLCMRPLLKPLIEGSEFYNEIKAYDKKQYKGITGLFKLRKSINSRKYDLAVIFPNSTRSGFISFLTRAKKRIGYERWGKAVFLTNSLKRPKKDGKFFPIYTGSYYAELMKLLNIEVDNLYPELPLSDDLVRKTDEIWQQATHNPQAMKVVMTPGASYGSSKLWPARHWGKLIDLLSEKYSANVIMAPGPGEIEFTNKIKDFANSKFFIQPPSFEGLSTLKGLIAKANLVVCNDTGPRHIAHAFKIPAVVTMGPTDPRHTYTPLEKAIIVRNEVSCSPCHMKICPFSHHACMEELMPAKLLSSAEKILAEESLQK